MADDELYRKQIVIEVVDNDAVTKVNRFEQKFNQSMARIEKMANVLGGKQIAPTITAKDRFSSSAQKAERMMKSINRMEARPTIKVRDMATSTINGIDRGLRSLTNKTWNIGLKVAGGALNTVKNVISGIGHAITSPLGMLGIGVGAAGAIQGGIVQPLNLAGSMEQSQIAFETMLGSAQKANKFLRDMQKFAASTPFEFPELQENAKLMLAFGFNTQKILPMLKTIGDTAAGLGVGSEGIERMVRALGQMQAKGRAQTEELLQLQELGVPVNEILQQELKLTNEQIANIGKEGIASGKVINAILRGMDKRFGGLMDKQSRSLLGLWSTIKDTFNMNILYRWGEGIRKAVEPRLQRIVDWFGKNEKTIQRWGDQLEKISGQAADWLLKKMQNTFNWLNTNFFNNPKFMKLDFEGKIHFIWDKIGEEFNKWYESKGKTLVTSWGEKIGSGLGAGLMALAGVDVSKNIKNNPFVDAGAAAGEAFLKGFEKTFDIGKIFEKIINMNKNAVLNPSSSNVLGTALADLIIITIGNKLLSPLFKIGKTVAKPTSSAIKWISDITKGTKVAKRMGNTTKAVKPISTILSQGKEYKAAYQLARETGKGPVRAMLNANKILKSTAPMSKESKIVKSIAKEGRTLSKIAKPLSKILLPLGIASSVVNVATSKDKTRAIAQEAGSWILGGLGTAFLGPLGGVAGFYVGDWLGGKAVDLGRKLFGKKTPSKKTAMTNIQNAGMNTYLNKSVYEPFREYVNRAESWGRNLILNFMRGRDSAGMSMGGWLNNKVYEPFRSIVNRAFLWGLNLIKNFMRGRDAAGMSMYGWLNNKVYLPFASMVVRAAAWGRNLIRNFNAGMSQIPVQTPHVTMPRATGPQEAHATGGILTRPHFALVAEEGPEAVIPLSIKRRERALRLWQETGRYLGVQAYAEGGYTAPARMATAGTGTIINLNFDLAGLVGQIVVNNSKEINQSVDEIVQVIAKKLKGILENIA